MANKIANYLRVRRRQWGLTQAELAFLLGYCSETIISRLEHNDRKLSLAGAAACALLFGGELRDLFPALFEQVEDGVVRRMYDLYERLKAAKPTQRTAAKLKLLNEALSRATSRPLPEYE